MRRWSFPAGELVRQHPPLLAHANKRAIFQIACPHGTRHEGVLEASRWDALPLPESADGAAAVRLLRARAGHFDYLAVAAPRAVEWHLNFSDRDLFFGYGGPLFAQDEIQVAEHPALAAFREALTAIGEEAVTVSAGRPTPFLIHGVQRHCRVAAENLYGIQLATAGSDSVRRAVDPVRPPTTTNVLAMAAPSGGYGCYTVQEIRSILVTAYTGFRAAVLESERLRGGACEVVVHTGWWGCGAFGGNRVMMGTLQALAAEMAGVNRIEFFVGGEEGFASLAEAADLLAACAGSLGHWINDLEAKNLEWGLSDGN